jgi:hypothetical protein
MRGSIPSSHAEFIMKGGTISRNNAESGGGVEVSGASFKKEPGAVIYGSDAGEDSNSAAGGGAAVLVEDTPDPKKREKTAGQDEELEAVYSDSDESYTSFSGDWDG